MGKVKEENVVVHGSMGAFIILVAFLLFGAVRCTPFGGHASMGENFTLTGTPEGIRAFGDYQNGALRTAKERNTSPNEYLAMRRSQEAEITQRETAPGFWQKWVGGTAK